MTIRIVIFSALASATAALVAAHASAAQTGATQPDTSQAHAVDDSLYRALGGKAGIKRIVADFTELLVTDPRTAETFAETDLDRFRTMLAGQFCQLSGGPCVYEGLNMKDAHTGFDITKAQFAAGVEDLQAAMRKSGVPFRTQNRLLALLASMHRDIVQK